MSDDLNLTDLDISKLDPLLQFYYCIRIAFLGIKVANEVISYDNSSLNNKVD